MDSPTERSGDLPVYYEGRVVGRATVRREGLYTEIRVTASGLPGCVCRAWARAGETDLPLGVLVPDGKQWTAARRFPTASICAVPNKCDVLSDIKEGDISDKNANIKCRNEKCENWMKYNSKRAIYRAIGDKTEILIPCDPLRPCALVPLFCFFTLTEHEGRLYWRLWLDDTGLPCRSIT